MYLAGEIVVWGTKVILEAERSTCGSSRDEILLIDFDIQDDGEKVLEQEWQISSMNLSQGQLLNYCISLMGLIIVLVEHILNRKILE